MDPSALKGVHRRRLAQSRDETARSGGRPTSRLKACINAASRATFLMTRDTSQRVIFYVI